MTIRPAISLSAVIREINNEINELFPSIMAPTVIEGNVSMSGGWRSRQAPRPCWTSWHSTTPSGRGSAPGRGPEGASADISATGRAVRVPHGHVGNTVRVTVGNAPTAFTTSTQSWSNTGLPISTKSLVLLGAATGCSRHSTPIGSRFRRWRERSSPSVGPHLHAQPGTSGSVLEQLASEQEAFFSSAIPGRIHFLSKGLH